MNPENNNVSQPAPGAQQPNSQFTAPVGPEPKNNKVLLWVSIAIVVLIVIGLIVFFMMRSGDKKEDTAKSTGNSSTSSSSSSKDNSAATNSKFEQYDVKDPLGEYSVSFYKHATTLNKNGLLYLIAGEQGSQTSAYLSLGEGNEIDCQGSPSTTMKLAGQSAKVCYREDGLVYSGQISVKGVATRVNVAGQQKVSMEDAKAILESFSFK